MSRETNRHATDRAAFLPALRAARGRINSGSNWLFSPEPRAAAHVSHQTEHLAPGTRIFLASDGFLALVTDYGAYDLEGLMAAAESKRSCALGEELRVIEAGDAQGEKFARFKTSDDATALLLSWPDTLVVSCPAQAGIQRKMLRLKLDYRWSLHSGRALRGPGCGNDRKKINWKRLRQRG